MENAQIRVKALAQVNGARKAAAEERKKLMEKCRQAQEKKTQVSIQLAQCESHNSKLTLDLEDIKGELEDAMLYINVLQQRIDILKENETADRFRINFSNEEKAKLQAGKDATEAKLEVRNPNPSGHKAHTL